MISKSRKPKKLKNRRISKRIELIKAVLLIILIAAVLRIFIVFPIKMPDDSMMSGFISGDFILASKLSYKFSPPAPGDIVVFEHPYRPDEKLARRIIAIEGQTVEIVGKMVYVNDEPLAEASSITHSDYRILPAEFSRRDYCPPEQVPSGQIYVLADNRDQSEDSRDFGFIDLTKVKGKGLYVYFSWAPDPDAPGWKSPYIIPAVQILFYNLLHFPSRIRWDRLFISS